MAVQYSYVMKGLTKTFPGAPKPVLNNISLQFLPGAKIAIIGPNGAGKSTLMKIMAGMDTEYPGRGLGGRGHHASAILPQEPHLDATKDVMGNVKDGVRPVADLVDRFNAISAEMGDPQDDTDFDKLMEEMGELQAKIDAVDGWALDSQLEQAMEALRCPPSEADVDDTVGRRAPPCGTMQAAARKARHPAARRADQPSRCRERAWLENHLKEYDGNVILVTHDRYFLDNVVTWVLELDRGRYYTYESNYSGYLEKKAKRLEQEDREEEGRQKAIRDELDWMRQTPKARQTKSKARIRAFDELVEAGEPHRGQGADPDPAARAAGRQGDRGQGADEGLSATSCCSTGWTSPCRRAASSA